MSVWCRICGAMTPIAGATLCDDCRESKIETAKSAERPRCESPRAVLEALLADIAIDPYHCYDIVESRDQWLARFDAATRAPAQQPVSLQVAQWHYEFRENGGYDCMYDAFVVLDSDNNTVVTVDLGDYGQQPCQPATAEQLARAEANARRIVGK